MVFFEESLGVAIVAADGDATSFGAWTSGAAWSTIKVPLAVAALRAGLCEPVGPVIVHSDNQAAEVLWSCLGDGAARQVQSVIREAGDPTTVVESRRLRAEYTPFGQTSWALVDQARFAAGLSRVADAAPVVQLMGQLCTEHRWGLAAKGYAAKGGWGPGRNGDYLVRQFGVVAGAGVALAVELHDAGYDAGVDIVDKLADWVVDRLTQQ